MLAAITRTALSVTVVTLLALAPDVRAENPPAPVDPELRELLRAAANDAESFPDRFDAEVWLTDMSRRLERRVPDARQRLEFLKTTHAEATRAGLPPELVLAVIEVESNFDAFAISSVGARGLMQVMPFWLNEIGRPGDSLFRVQTNLRYGCTILKFYLRKEKGNLRAALARYNGDRRGRTYWAKVDRAMRARWYRQ
jgi:soluble lytic murein transglycosylase-like protein